MLWLKSTILELPLSCARLLGKDMSKINKEGIESTNIFEVNGNIVAEISLADSRVPIVSTFMTVHEV